MTKFVTNMVQYMILKCHRSRPDANCAYRRHRAGSGCRCPTMARRATDLEVEVLCGGLSGGLSRSTGVFPKFDESAVSTYTAVLPRVHIACAGATRGARAGFLWPGHKGCVSGYAERITRNHCAAQGLTERWLHAGPETRWVTGQGCGSRALGREPRTALCRLAATASERRAAASGMDRDGTQDGSWPTTHVPPADAWGP